jgi:hypothetical protein
VVWLWLRPQYRIAPQPIKRHAAQSTKELGMLDFDKHFPGKENVYIFSYRGAT